MANEKENQPGRQYLPVATIYHPKKNGNGSALAFRLTPANDRATGFLQMEFAKQSFAGDEEQKLFPRFDWEHRIKLRLNPYEVAELIEVFRGIKESLRDGAGFIHNMEKRTAVLRVAHATEPVPYFAFHVIVTRDGEDDSEAKIGLTPSEVLAIETGLSSSMGRMLFGN